MFLPRPPESQFGTGEHHLQSRHAGPLILSLPLSFNGIGVGLGGLIGFGIGHIKGALQSWRYEFLVVGAVCAAWGLSLSYTLSNSPTRHRGFTHDERLMIIARLKRNQTGIENRVIKWDQIREAFLDYKTWIFFSLGLIGVSAIPMKSYQSLIWRSFRTSPTAASRTSPHWSSKDLGSANSRHRSWLFHKARSS